MKNFLSLPTGFIKLTINTWLQIVLYAFIPLSNLLLLSTIGPEVQTNFYTLKVTCDLVTILIGLGLIQYIPRGLSDKKINLTTIHRISFLYLFFGSIGIFILFSVFVSSKESIFFNFSHLNYFYLFAFIYACSANSVLINASIILFEAGYTFRYCLLISIIPAFFPIIFTLFFLIFYYLSIFNLSIPLIFSFVSFITLCLIHLFSWTIFLKYTRSSILLFSLSKLYFVYKGPINIIILYIKRLFNLFLSNFLILSNWLLCLSMTLSSWLVLRVVLNVDLIDYHTKSNFTFIMICQSIVLFLANSISTYYYSRCVRSNPSTSISKVFIVNKILLFALFFWFSLFLFIFIPITQDLNLFSSIYWLITYIFIVLISKIYICDAMAWGNPIWYSLIKFSFTALYGLFFFYSNTNIPSFLIIPFSLYFIILVEIFSIIPYVRTSRNI